MLSVAVPEEFKVPVPICVAPSLNVTEPVGDAGSRQRSDSRSKRDRLPQSYLRGRMRRETSLLPPVQNSPE